MADNNYHLIYVEQCIRLAQTMVVKSEDVANAQNQYLILVYGEQAVEPEARRTWRYYKNLAGQYHSTDEPMYVTSMDTLERILFSVDNLKLHRATYRGYSFGERGYQELVRQYPKQVALIHGILNPIDIDKAIAAPDGEILFWDRDLVEVNEYGLIDRIRTAIASYRLRWTNQQYQIANDLYVTTWYTILYLMLVPAIMAYRNEACQTNEAHSYHVRMYLASRGVDHSIIDYLTVKQSLWLYRNINYIQRHAGQTDTFNWLVEHIMTERQLPLAEYTMRHDLKDLVENTVPLPVFRRRDLNEFASATSETIVELNTILDKEEPLAPDNYEYRSEVQSKIMDLMRNSPTNVLMTKLLESAMIDYSDSTPYTMEDILANMWLELASKGLYNTVVTFTNPKTGERIPLVASDAYVMAMYALAKSYEVELETVPTFYAQRVPIMPAPPVDDLMRMVDRSLISETFAQEMRLLMPTLARPIISTEAFYDFCIEQHKAANAQRARVSMFEHRDARGFAMGLIERLYSDNMRKLSWSGRLYKDFLADKNISTAGLSRDNWAALYLELTREATGLALSSAKTIANLQAAMVRLLLKLSSYSIQIARSINASRIRSLDWPMWRVADMEGSSADLVLHPDLNVRVQSGEGSSKHQETFDVLAMQDEFSGEGRSWHQQAYELKSLVSDAQAPARFHYDVDTAPIGVTLLTPLKSNERNVIPVAGIEEWLKLTPDQQRDFDDEYGGNPMFQ